MPAAWLIATLGGMVSDAAAVLNVLLALIALVAGGVAGDDAVVVGRVGGKTSQRDVMRRHQGRISDVDDP